MMITQNAKNTAATRFKAYLMELVLSDMVDVDKGLYLVR